MLALYFTFFSGGWADDQGTWGQFGDFIGGVVNPALALITVWMLLSTLSEQQEAVRLQRESLEVQREELRLTRAELKDSADALKRQVEQFDKKSLKDDLYARADEVYREFLDYYNSKFSWAGQVVKRDDGEPVRSVSGETMEEVLDAIQHLDDGEELNIAYAWRFRVSRAANLLIELCEYMAEIDSLSGGNMLATHYFRHRLGYIATLFHEAGSLPAEFWKVTQREYPSDPDF